MKLHLPKNLLMAMLMTAISATVYAETESAEILETTENQEYIEEEGEPILLSADGQRDIGKAKLDALILLPKTTGKGDLTIGQDETMGIYDSNGKLITSGFGTHTDSSPNESATITNNVKVGSLLSSTYNLTLNANAVVALGGEYQSQYIGLTAKNVTVNNTATLIAGRLEAASLTATGASTVNLHTGGSGPGYRGGNTIGNNSYDKQTKIDGAITVKDGASVTIGVDNGQNGNNSYNEQFLNVLGGTITQDSSKVIDEQTNATLSEKSTLAIKGRTYISGKLDIDQSGGDMEIALWHRNPVAGSTGNVPSILRLGQSSGNTITQTTAGSMKIGQIACGENGNSNSQIAIEQQGSGTIELVNGVAFSTKDANSYSTIKQTNTINKGTIKLNGDFTSATFNITQDGNSNKELNGNIVLNGKMKAHEIKVGGNMEVNVNSELGYAAEDSLLTIVGQGHLKNSGKINMDIYMEDGELTATDGSTFANITAREGVITISGTVNITGELILGNATMVSTFSANSTEGKVVVNLLDAKSGISMTDIKNLALGDDVVFNVMVDSLDELDANDTLTIFNLKENETVKISQQITVTDKDGNEKVVTYTDKGNGSVTVNAVVPEPTTATLSLLALAALAARRRRK